MKLVKLVPAFMILGLALMACGGAVGWRSYRRQEDRSSPAGGTDRRYDTKDMPYFKAKLAALCSNCTLIYSNAKQDAPTQQTQAEAAITNGANVIVLDRSTAQQPRPSSPRRKPRTSRSSPMTG